MIYSAFISITKHFLTGIFTAIRHRFYWRLSLSWGFSEEPLTALEHHSSMISEYSLNGASIMPRLVGILFFYFFINIHPMYIFPVWVAIKVIIGWMLSPILFVFILVMVLLHNFKYIYERFFKFWCNTFSSLFS